MTAGSKIPGGSAVWEKSSLATWLVGCSQALAPQARGRGDFVAEDREVENRESGRGSGPERAMCQHYLALSIATKVFSGSVNVSG